MMFYEFTSRLDEIAAKHLMITEEIPTYWEYKTFIEPVYQEWDALDDVHGKDQIALIYAALGIQFFKDKVCDLYINKGCDYCPCAIMGDIPGDPFGDQIPYACRRDIQGPIPALEVNHGDLL